MCHAHLMHVPCTSYACAMHILCICHAHAMQVPCTSYVCAVHMLCMCQAHLMRVPCTCYACAMHILCMCHAHAMHGPCTCYAHKAGAMHLLCRFCKVTSEGNLVFIFKACLSRQYPLKAISSMSRMGIRVVARECNAEHVYLPCPAWASVTRTGTSC